MKTLKFLLSAQLLMPTLSYALPVLQPPPSPMDPPSLLANPPLYTAPPQPGYTESGAINPTESPIPPPTAAGRIDLGRRTHQAFSEANAQAIHWINLIDAQAFNGTWLDGGGIMRDVVTERQWVAGMHATRTSLGPVHSRKVSSHVFTSSLPYGAQGNFIVIRYDTRFQRMYNAVEVVTLQAEGPLGLWRVIGYRIEPFR